MAKRKTIKQLQKQCDRIVTAIYTGMPCIICGKPGFAHHLIPKGRCAIHRHSIQNLVPLCISHHTYSVEIAAHSTSSAAVMRFCGAMRDENPRRYHWWMDHEHDGANSDVPKATKAHYEERIAWWKAHEDSGRTIEEALAAELAATEEKDNG